jgi:Ca-activated chloride channel family protein
MQFAIDYAALGIVALMLLLACLVKAYFFPPHPSPSLNFSHLQTLSSDSLKIKLAPLPLLLQQIGLFCLILAFIDPHFLVPYQPDLSHQEAPIPTKGIAIYLLLDQSGSMNEKVATRQGELTKMDLLKRVTAPFIQNHASDLIGLIAFSRVPKILVPLTLDQSDLLTQIQQLNVVTDASDDGTAMGYAIFKAANLISATRHFAEELPTEAKPAYEIKNSIIVVVTDGLQDPNKLDYGNRLRTIELDDAANYAKSQGIKVYIVNVDPKISSAALAPQRRQMQTITELTGGKLFIVGQGLDLQQVYEAIDLLEKETIPSSITAQDSKSTHKRVNLFPYFILLALVSFFSAIALESLVLKRVP